MQLKVYESSNSQIYLWKNYNHRSKGLLQHSNTFFLSRVLQYKHIDASLR